MKRYRNLDKLEETVLTFEQNKETDVGALSTLGTYSDLGATPVVTEDPAEAAELLDFTPLDDSDYKRMKYPYHNTVGIPNIDPYTGAVVYPGSENGTGAASASAPRAPTTRVGSSATASNDVSWVTPLIVIGLIVGIGIMYKN